MPNNFYIVLSEGIRLTDEAPSSVMSRDHVPQISSV